MHLGVVTFLILPLFALGNAGVQLGAGVVEKLTHPVSVGIILGLCGGKQLGIFLFSLPGDHCVAGRRQRVRWPPELLRLFEGGDHVVTS